ncbi:MAG: MATE family efflux transporter [Synergistaceae bacterium]|nr:MATE family efflux transporter [Synergistaceae bacterium]
MEKTAIGRPENKMGVMPIHKLLLSMSIPMVISMLVQAAYNIVDSIFVAQISESALTAVSLAFPVQSLMIGVGVGTGVGLNAFLSKSLGEKNFGNVNRSALNGILLSWISCAVFMFIGAFLSPIFFRSQTNNPEIAQFGREYLSVVCVFSYGMFNQIIFERLLMSTGRTLYSMISQIAGAVTNIILDPIMIFGLLGFPRLGVMGAAIATVVGQTFGACVALYFNLRINREIKFSLRGFRPSLSIMGRIYSVGLPSILLGSLGSIMIYVLNRLLISFTATAVAVFGVYFKLQSFVFMPIFALNNGMVPIVAYNYGAKKKDRIIKTVKLSLAYATGIMLLGMAIFQIFPGALLRQFNATPEMLALGIPALRLISSHFIFAAFCIISLSVFQALGNGAESLIVAVSRQLILLLPIAWLLSLTGSVDAIWWTFPITEFVTLILCAFMMRRVYLRKIRDM